MLYSRLNSYTGRILRGIVAALAILAYAVPARAQFIGYTSPQSVQQILASNVACTGVAQIFPVQNLGQTQHFVYLIPLGPAKMVVEIQGKDAAGNLYRISDQSIQPYVTTTTTLTATGYFPTVQVSVTCSPGSSTFTLNYSGTSATSIEKTGAYQIAQLDKVIFNGIAGTASQTLTFQPPYLNSSGLLVFHPVAMSVASSIQVVCLGIEPALSPQSGWRFLVAGSITASQVYNIPSATCSSILINYTGQAMAPAFDLEYIFFEPGQRENSTATTLLQVTEAGFPLDITSQTVNKGPRWVVNHSPAAGTQAVASIAVGGTAGTAGVRHVADCVSYTLAASTAPAATTLTLNLRNGATGAGSVIWSKSLAAPAATGVHVDGNLCGLNLLGSVNTAMTLEFSAGLANELESVSLTGFDVQ